MAQSVYLLAAGLGAFLLLGCSRDCDSPAKGCPCDPLKDAPFCASGPETSVGFSCEGGRWATGPDGPCMPIRDGGRSMDVAMSADLATPGSNTTGMDSAIEIDRLESFDVSTSSQ
jgi:hypothetical protein